MHAGYTQERMHQTNIPCHTRIFLHLYILVTTDTLAQMLKTFVVYLFEYQAVS